jgi:hypothetical protein
VPYFENGKRYSGAEAVFTSWHRFPDGAGRSGSISTSPASRRSRNGYTHLSPAIVTQATKLPAPYGARVLKDLRTASRRRYFLAPWH